MDLRLENTAKFFLAVSRGRVLECATPLLSVLNCTPLDGFETSRKLVVKTSDSEIDLLILRGIDVLTYVEHGVAGLGIVGRDMLMEHEGCGVYELLDLGVSCCRMVVAGPGDGLVPGNGDNGRRLRVATKYPNTTLDYFAGMGKQVEIIKLNGATELAPRLGLSNLIVDLVDSGETLRANGLKVSEEVAHISARLVANRALMRTQFEYINHFVERIKHAMVSLAREEK